jgi:hypothetical protein
VPSLSYILDWSKPSGYVKLGEYDVPLPVMPPLETMENYGLPIEQQKFKRTIIPSSLVKKKSFQEDSDEEKFIINEYHKIHNGIWVIIKGNPVYITGAYYFFLNYWTTNQGTKPDFKLIQCHLFLIWEMAINDRNCYGLFLVKPRRIGGTEITIEWQYVDVLRYRNMVCGMQSKNEDSVYKNYKRILNAHKNMIWFMKPINQGSTGNREGLFLRYPEEMLTAKKLKDAAENGEAENQYEDPEINSDLTYQPSVATAYDGERLDRYILNEFGKSEKMSVVDCWDKVKPCLHLDNGIEITGKAVCESTIEEINDDQIQELVGMWNEGDISNKDENGRTTSGLWRVFISAIDAAKEDEWGIPKRKETEEFLERQFDALKKAGKTKELAKLKRKVPLVIEDALTPSGDQCAFNKDNLIDALAEIDFPDKKDKKPTVRGNLMWENGTFDGLVIFEPNPKGRWEFSVLPSDKTYKSNHVEWHGQDRIPGNVNKIRIGIDPYDHKETVDNRKSKGGATGGLMYDDLLDGAKVSDDGKPFDLGKDWETHKVIFTYYERRDDPQDFFEDMLMSAVFCGAPILFENNKQSIRNHFHNRGYKMFVMLRPEGTMSSVQRQGVITDGIPASENTIQQYYDAIDTYISRNAKSIKHRDLIVDLLSMNRSNHGKHDLGVSFGWLLIAMTKKYANVKPKDDDEGEPWF